MGVATRSSAKMGSLHFLLFFACLVVSVFGSPKRLFGIQPANPAKPVKAGGDAGKKSIDEYSDEELLQELSELVSNLNEDQLKSLEEILEKEDLDEKDEFSMITAELKDIGMEEDDIKDLKKLADLIHDFLIEVPNINENLELNKEPELDLKDQIQLYLLGLPNKLGPLGYIALHKVLEDESEDDYEATVVSVGPPVPIATAVQEQPKPVTFRRRRHAGDSYKSYKATSHVPSYYKVPTHAKEIKVGSNQYH